MDVFRIPKKTWHVARSFDLGKLPGGTVLDAKDQGEGILPEILVINVLCPMYAPGIFYSVNDGKGFMTTFFFRLGEKAKRRIAEKKPSSAIKLLRRFMDQAPSCAEMRGRLKGIVRAANMDELPLNPIISGLAHRYNGTPFLIHEHEARYFAGANYFEMDIDLHNWSLITRNAFYQLSGILDKIRGHYAFVVEAREEEEMPEQLCCVTQIYAMDGINAPEFPYIDTSVNHAEEEFFDENSE